MYRKIVNYKKLTRVDRSVSNWLQLQSLGRLVCIRTAREDYLVLSGAVKYWRTLVQEGYMHSL